MDEQAKNTPRGNDVEPLTDMDEGLRVSYSVHDDSEDHVHLEVRDRHHMHDRRHVDLHQEEYTPEEAARLLGMGRDVVLHAVYDGELKADRKGRKVVCIARVDLIDWLRRRGPGV